MKNLKFFKCNHCGKVIEKFSDKGVPALCCGEEMKELIANTVEASTEKHLPVVSFKDGFIEVKVGSVAHPMEETHYINFIAIETNKSVSNFYLMPGMYPEAKMLIDKNEVKAVYEYCNLHGLWKVEL